MRCKKMFENREQCVQFVKKYALGFKRVGVTADNLWHMSRHADIVCRYTHTESGKVTEQKTETVSVQNYANVISSVPFFADRVQKTNTPFGKIGTVFTAHNPYADETVKREFFISYKD